MSTERARSHWGWGWADKFPDEETRKGMCAHLAARLGFEGRVRPVPRIEDANVPPPRIEPPSALAAFCTTDRVERLTRTYGRSYRDLVRGYSGEYACAPDVVAKVRNEADIEALFEWCGRMQIALIPYGGGTSVVSGVEADVGDGYQGAVCLDMRAMDKVLEVDRTSRAARIQAGVTGPHLEAQLAPHGLSLRHFPQSFEFSTLGGWIATRAGGHFATVYTHIDDMVESVRMLTPVGAYESRRLPGSGAGPSPDRLVLGSEGTLGVITEAWMRLHPRPRYRTRASVHFTDFASAVEATRLVSQSGLYPTNCRLLDANEAALNMVTDDGAHVLLLAFESGDSPRDASMARAVAICESKGGKVPRGVVSKDDGDRPAAPGVLDRKSSDAGESWRGAFLEAPYLQSVLVTLGVIADTFETAITWDKFDALHQHVTRSVTETMKRVCGAGKLTCRFTHVYPDGPAPYYTFLAPAREGQELAQWREIKEAASNALIDCGATITHHHAVGRLHRPWYDRQRPEPFAAALKASKRALDPAGVLNPGVLIDP